MQEFCKSLQY